MSETIIDETRRLHPFTLVYRGLASLPAFAILIYPAVRNPDTGTLFYVILSVIYGFFALPWIFLYYHRFRFRITPKEVIIERGVLTRQHRSIPIERILNVEIQQRMLSRLMGIASVSLETAGSSTAEASIEYVSLSTAREIRQVIRSFQKQRGQDPETPLETASDPSARAAVRPEGTTDPAPASTRGDGARLLHYMPLKAVLQCGAFQFSLVYIALIFGALQFFGFLDADRIEEFFLNRPEQFQFIQTVPLWMVLTYTLIIAALMAWLTGLLVTSNRFFNFRLYLDDDKLHKRHGLLTISEGTIPLKKVQAIALHANLAMRLFDRCVMEVQTMGLDPSQSGRRVAVPLARQGEIEALIPSIYASFLPPESFASVSRITIRRMTIRFTVTFLIFLVPVIYLWPDGIWLLLLTPCTLLAAYLQYRHHGYALDQDTVYVKRGFWNQHVWIIPVDKLQTISTTSTIFQRRLGLKTLHIDTAGGSALNYPQVIDLPAEIAEDLLEVLYTRFQRVFHERRGRLDRAILKPDIEAETGGNQHESDLVRKPGLIGMLP